MIERRQIERFQLSLAVRLVTMTPERKKEVFEINSSNISAHGAFFKTVLYIPKGTPIQVDFVLPVERLVKLIGMYSFVKARGMVVRSNEEGIAISFNDGYEMMPFKGF